MASGVRPKPLERRHTVALRYEKSPGGIGFVWGKDHSLDLDMLSLNGFYVQAEISGSNFHTNPEFKDKVGSGHMNAGKISEMKTRFIRVGRTGAFVCKSVCA